MSDLRAYQLDAIARVRESMRKHRRVLLVAPTGFGKTHTAAELIRRSVERGRRVLFLVHRREIVIDTATRLRRAGVPCGVTMAGFVPAGDPPVVVASIATITAREHHPRADLVIWDEAHHAAASSYRDIAAQYPEAHHLGLTATPERGDGVGLRDAFDDLVLGARMSDLQRDGYLAYCDVIGPGRKMGGTIALSPAEAVREHARGLPTVIFAKSIEDSLEAARELGGAHIDGNTPPDRRARDLARFASGEIDVLTNVYVLTEGWDCPRAKCCVLARGVGSAGAYLQMVGRVLRAHEGQRALVIDLGGSVYQLGLPDEDRIYSLDGVARAAPKDRPWIAQCQACGYTVLGTQRGAACAECGAAWPPPPRAEIERAEIGAVTLEHKRAEYARLQEIADARGYKDGWIAHRYREKFGVWPRGVRE